jgi:hypothetical protein
MGDEKVTPVIKFAARINFSPLPFHVSLRALARCWRLIQFVSGKLFFPPP